MEFLEEIIPLYNEFIEEEGSFWWESFKDRNQFFSEHLSKDNIDQLDEATLIELVHKLWSFQIWTNKDYVVNQILESGIEHVRKSFKELLYGNKSLAERFDIIKSLKRIGPSTASEILSIHDPTNYCFWNRRSQDGLIRLGVDEPEFLGRMQGINGKKYEKICDLMKSIQKQIAKKYPEFDDLLKLDVLLYFISSNEISSDAPPRIKTTSEEIIHKEVIDKLLALGTGLGFDVDDEVPITYGCRVDAIWKSRIANLGQIAYVFEVHRSGSRDSAIMNLQRALEKDSTIQKVAIVSSEDELEKFEKEISSLPEKFRKSVIYFDVDDLEDALSHLGSLMDILESLKLIEKRFN